MSRMPVPTVGKESLAHLTGIYPDDFIRNFILDLMETFVKVPPNKLTPNELILFQHLKKIEMANALFFKYAKIKAQSEHTIPPNKPSLHFIQWSEVKDAYTKYSKMDFSIAEGKIYALATDYEALDKAAHVITVDHHNNSRRIWNSSSTPLTGAIYTLMTTHYSRSALAKRISEHNRTEGTVRDIYSATQINLANEISRAKELENQLEVTRADLNESMSLQLLQNRTLDSSAQLSQNGPASHTGRLFTNDPSFLNIKRAAGPKRWACVTGLVQAYREANPLVLPLLDELLKTLLTPYTGREQEDKTVEAWLEKNRAQVDPKLAKVLESYKTLPPHRPDLSTRDLTEAYYQSLALCFSANGSTFFPHIEDLAKTFYNLRPSKKKEEPAAASASAHQAFH